MAICRRRARSSSYDLMSAVANLTYFRVVVGSSWVQVAHVLVVVSCMLVVLRSASILALASSNGAPLAVSNESCFFLFFYGSGGRSLALPGIADSQGRV